MISDSSESSLRPSGRQIHDDDDDDEVVVKVGEEEVVVVEDERSLYARLCALLFPFMVVRPSLKHTFSFHRVYTFYTHVS